MKGKFTYKAVDYIQHVWKTVYNIDKSKSQIRRDLEQGAISINGVKLNANSVFIFDVELEDD